MWGYIVSVVIYFIIFKASISLCRNILENQRRLERLKKMPKVKSSVSVFTICLIPIIRLLMLIVLYAICFCSDEMFDEIIEGNKKDNENND